MRALLLVGLFALLPAARAQSTLQISGTAAVPQGSFSDALGAVGGGVSVGYLYQIPNAPLAVGLEGSAVLYGYERRREPFSLTIPDVDVAVTTSNNLAQGLAVFRLQVPNGPVRPYVDGLVGVSYLFTSTSVSDVCCHAEEYPIASSTNYDDAALAYGGGVGTQVRLHNGVSDEGRPYEVLLDARVRYLAGGEASYLGRGDIERYEDGTIRLYPRRSRTDLVSPQLGLTFRF
jgi:hypothetical protein